MNNQLSNRYFSFDFALLARILKVMIF